MYRPNVVIAEWMNEERTRAYHLQANGDLVEISRERPSDMWSPPEHVQLQKADASLEALFVALTKPPLIQHEPPYIERNVRNAP